MYRRPVDTTANPQWFEAPSALELVPRFTGEHPDSDALLKLCGATIVTQGPEAGKRFAEVILPWQAAVIQAIAHVREIFLLCGKGSGKSMGAAALALGFTMLSHVRRRNTRGQIIVMASSVGAARIVWEHALEAVLADAELRPQFKTAMQARTLTHVHSGIEIQILSVDLSQVVGRRPVLLIIDELHVLAQIREAMQALDQLRKGGANWGPAFKVVTITTMSIDPPEGEFARQLKYARDVRDGRIVDASFLPLIFEFPVLQRPDLDPLDPAHWWRGMPSLRTADQPGTMDAGEVQREIDQARDAEDVQAMSLVLSQRLGIEANVMAATARSPLHLHWPRAPLLPPGPIPPQASLAVAIDVGGLDDPLALCFCWRPSSSSRAICIRVLQFLVHEAFQGAGDSLRLVYSQALEAGSLSLHDSVEALDAAVFAAVRTVLASHQGFFQCGGDAHGRTGFAERFTLALAPFTGIPQNYELVAALAELEGLLADGIVVRGACPLLDANVANLAIEELPSGAKRLRKRDSGAHSHGKGRSKIDGIVAVLNALKLQALMDAKAVDVASWIG